MKIWIATAAVTLAAPMAWSAPLIDLTGSVGYSFNGLDEGTLANNSMDLTSDSANSPAGLDHEVDAGLYAAAKIGLPVLPDIGLKYESLVSNGSNTITDTISYGGESQSYAEDVESELDMSYLDVSLTYGVPLPMSSIDFGLNFRTFMGGFKAEGQTSGQKLEASFSDGPVIVPMLYLAGSFAPPIPSTDLTLSGEIKTLPLDTNVTDWNLKATWFAPLPTNALGKLGVEGGYRNYGVTISDNTAGADTADFASEISYSGFFLGATVQF
ncbi:hypothetical protein BGP77_07475 [Saccharospirillum sp. MSK14-1]|uniref:hypothetical protein n=1 Tax=Saccharospirillum sp. MSK14-1 TaxID=1897632 RepID=UPI000D3921C4|nr:hypothetical protein [Saccharospirillum sp. MSK14-1]PTY37108.1 hypothetical protein BGP77_07475 [Saccharospirillum sp. MSK14-1]